MTIIFLTRYALRLVLSKQSTGAVVHTMYGLGLALVGVKSTTFVILECYFTAMRTMWVGGGYIENFLYLYNMVPI
jgi:hypothetical protein